MAFNEDVKLLGALVSPFVIRVRILLSMKGVSYEYIEEDLVKKSPLLLASNPMRKKVPVLIHNGKPICESLLIMQYIDHIWGSSTPVLPADPYQRFTALFWAAFVDEKLFPALRDLMRATNKNRMLQMVKEAHAAINRLEGLLARFSKMKDVIGSESIGFLNIVIGSYFISIESLGRMHGVKFIDRSNTPLLAAWTARFADTSAAKTVLPGIDRAVEYMKMLRASIASARAAKL